MYVITAVKGIIRTSPRTHDSYLGLSMHTIEDKVKCLQLVSVLYEFCEAIFVDSSVVHWISKSTILTTLRNTASLINNYDS